MKLAIVLTALFAFALLVTGVNPAHLVSTSAQDAKPSEVFLKDKKPVPRESTTQPADSILFANDSEDPTGLVLKESAAFDHAKHSTEAKYSVDGKAVVGCVECHHTDQPSSKEPYYKTFERDAVLTAANIGSQNVRSCRVCHLSAAEEETVVKVKGKDLTVPPDSVTYPAGSGKKAGKDKIYNDEAYHLNCNGCHDAARASGRKDLNPKTPSKCDDCHTTK